jgi:hypothetical protein
VRRRCRRAGRNSTPEQLERAPAARRGSGRAGLDPGEEPRCRPQNSDSLEDVRAGWDSHVAFGLEFPGAYAHIYGNVKPGVLCKVTEDVLTVGEGR